MVSYCKALINLKLKLLINDINPSAGGLKHTKKKKKQLRLLFVQKVDE